jgi:hypothetical protein
MARRSSVDPAQVRFVFRGAVQRFRATTSRMIKATPQTAIATVDEVIEGPDLLTQLAGHEITVQFDGRKRPKRGEQVIFRSAGWLFGDSIAVGVVDFSPVAASHLAIAAAGATPTDPAVRLAQRDIQSRFDRADVVASGRVLSVSLPPGTPAAMALDAAEATIEGPLSEHTPLWRDAVVELHAMHKGRHSGEHATVRFPASTDVMWFRAPKFHAGQEGFFMLHKAELAGSKRRDVALAAGGPSEETFTALHPADFQPFDQPGGVRQAIGASSDAAANDIPV